MQFRTFVWPAEPETLKISQHREVISEVTEEGEWFVQNITTVGRVFEGEGTFFGPNCYAHFELLAALMRDGISGKLKLAHWGEYTALLTELDVTEGDREEYLRYRFRFIELP